MLAATHPLAAILQRVVADLADPRNHYLVLTSALETPNGPVLLGSLHLHQSSAWQLTIKPDALTCEVQLAPGGERTPVRAAYSRIWQVRHGSSPHFTTDDAEGLLYDNGQVLASFAREGLAE